MEFFFAERIFTSFHELEAALEKPPVGSSPTSQIPVDSKNAISTALNAIRLECLRAHLSLSMKWIDEILRLLNVNQTTFHDIRPGITELRNRLRHELSDAHFAVVAREKFPLLQAFQPPFGPQVAVIFPEANQEAIEALNCYAFERNTACVFHLMRAIESALKEYSSELQVEITGPRSWGEILGKTEAALKSHAQAFANQSLGDAARETIVYLRIIKDAWRNPTMHMIRSYTDTQAAEILNATRTFLQNLAAVVKALKTTKSGQAK